MNPKRAWDLYCKAEDSFRMKPMFNHIQSITLEEKEEVMKVWKAMPGYTCFADALAHIAKEYIEGDD